SRTMKRTAALLDSFRLVTARILKARLEGRKDNPTGAELVEAVQRDFEAHMNSDLGVGTAFDSIFSHLVKLDKMREKGLLSQGHVKKLRETLERIDRVWNVIF
ncbi:MAG TPA: hypothetical protein VMX75_03315, partial [Spirochaetia bacterium]|nr:hypothetical protein [Spirochaetia bacterium]